MNIEEIIKSLFMNRAEYGKALEHIDTESIYKGLISSNIGLNEFLLEVKEYLNKKRHMITSPYNEYECNNYIIWQLQLVANDYYIYSNLSTIYKYTAEEGWNPIDDFIGAMNKATSDQNMAYAGFAATSFGINYEKTGVGYIVYPYTPVDNMLVHDYKYLVVMDIGGETYDVAIPTMPDLLSLTKDLSVIAKSADTLKK